MGYFVYLRAVIMLVSVGVFLAILSLVLGQDILPPIPVRPTNPGVILGNGQLNAKVTVEAFLEMNCGDSARAWPMLNQIQQSYNPEEVVVIIQQMVLPYHRNAYVSHQGYNLVLAQAPSRLPDYIQAMFDNLGNFSNSATNNMTDIQVLDRLAVLAEQATGIDQDTFKAQIGSYGSQTVALWKYAVRRGTAGTPWYFINGVDLAFSPNNTLDFATLKAYIDNLLAQSP